MTSSDLYPWFCIQLAFQSFVLVRCCFVFLFFGWRSGKVSKGCIACMGVYYDLRMRKEKEEENILPKELLSSRYTIVKYLRQLDERDEYKQFM